MKHLFLFFCVVAALAMTIGCGDSADKVALTKEQKDSLRRADSAALKIGVLPTEDCLPIVVAKELRLFDTLGVDVRLRHYHALSECHIALRESLVEGAAIDSTLFRTLKGENVGGSAKFDIAKPLELTGGPATATQSVMLASKKARITRVSQLTDRIIAADSHGESYRMAALATDSLRRKKQHVFIVQIEDVRVRADMLINGNVDVAVLPEPFATKARKAGANVLGTVSCKPQGVVAFRSAALGEPNRSKQYALFCKALTIAQDSIQKYGRKKYVPLLNW